MLSKKTVFWASLIVFIGVYIVSNPLIFGFCRNIGVWSAGSKYCYDTAYISKPFVILGLYMGATILLISLITYKIRDEVFYSWLKFAYWWIPLTVILTAITPEGNGSWGVPNILTPGLVALVFTAIFVIVSLLIIPIKYLKLKGKWN